MPITRSASTEAISKEEFVRNFVRELQNSNAAIFAGAGLSMAAGYVDWKGLLKDAMRDLGIDNTDEPDLVRIAQYYCNKTGSKSALTQTIFDHFAASNSPTKNHRILAALPIQTYWTTNYDKLIETAVAQAHKVVDVKHTVAQLGTTRRDRTVVVYKMHGDVDHASEAIITRDDYERYSTKMLEYVTALRGDLVEKTFLFIGFSFNDPNIDYVLSRIRIHGAGTQRRHYCIQKAVAQEKGEPRRIFERRRLKQEYFIADLKRFNVATVLVDSYAAITGLLTEVADAYRCGSVFVSGAAYDFAPWKRDAAEQFLADLAYSIVRKELRLVTGFGLGVGRAIVAGATAALDESGKEVTDHTMVLRPFPAQLGKGPSRTAAYRAALVKEAGIAVFVFGNKQDAGGATVLSDGMKKEFDEAVNNGAFPIPVGATGYMAEELWNEVSTNPAKYFSNVDLRSVRPALAALGDKKVSYAHLLQSLETIIAAIRGA